MSDSASPVADPSEPRVPLLSPAAAATAAERVGIDPKYLTQPIWGLLLRRPKYAKAVYAVLTDLLFRGTLDARTRELMIMRLGWGTAAEFEWAQHWQVAERAGVDPRDVLAVRDWPTSDRFDDRDRSVLAAVDDVIRRGLIGTRAWADLTRHFDEDELLEVAAIAATWHYISVLVRTLRVPLDDGMVPWPPDGTVPTPLVS